MTGQHARRMQQLISGYDFQKHMFYAVDEDQGFLEALCGHSVPPERLVDPSTTELTPKDCMECLLRHGSQLADEHGDSVRWSDG